MQPPSLQNSLFRILGRIIALLSVVVLLPLIGVVRLFRSLHRQPYVALPTSDDPQLWKTFDLLSFAKKGEKNSPKIPIGFINNLPILFNIILGDVHFTGVPPRTAEEINKLPKDPRSLYLRSQVGLITLASVELPENASKEEIYTSEAYYTVNFGFTNHIRLCCKWLVKKILNIFK